MSACVWEKTIRVHRVVSLLVESGDLVLLQLVSKICSPGEKGCFEGQTVRHETLLSPPSPPPLAISRCFTQNGQLYQAQHPLLSRIAIPLLTHLLAQGNT